MYGIFVSDFPITGVGPITNSSILKLDHDKESEYYENDEVMRGNCKK